jgi:hypothetical protein
MYSDDWNPEINQNFNLTYVGKSWVAKRGFKEAAWAGKALDFANSTSFALHDIVKMISKSRRNASIKRALTRGLITFEDFQKIRIEMGMELISPRYARNLKLQSPSLTSEERRLQEGQPIDLGPLGLGQME